MVNVSPWVRPGQLLTISAVLLLTGFIGTVRAQTVIVQRAEPGSTIELLLNGTPMATVVTQPGGIATLRMTITDRPNRWQSTITVLVDTCGTTRRVHLIERDRGGPPPVGPCTRDSVDGFFLLQSNTSMLVDVGVGRPTLRLRQGNMPSSWVTVGEIPSDSPLERMSLYVFGAGAVRNLQAPIDRVCGDVPCEGSAMGLAYNGGVGFWIAPFLAVQGDYTHIPAFDITGAAAGYQFDSTFGTNLLTVSGLVGYPLGSFRPYVRGGAARHRSVTTTTQATAPTTFIIDGVENTDPGGVQVYGVETEGWGWLVGGGAEMWPNTWFSLFGEFTWTYLRGSPTDGSEGDTDDRLMLWLFGVKVRVGP